MGNCLSSQSADDLSLLNDSEGASLPGEPPPPYQERAAQHVPVFQPLGGPPPQLSEEEQVRLALRIGLIQHLPRGIYQPSQQHPDKRNKECVICMMDFELGDAVRYLPCLHTYHVDCIDAWLMRSFTCPSCLEPVDAALLCSYQTN
ncbi:RING finger protein 11-like [Alosa pseudoharengus]|uniref:RING finger protein 11-like n=1 Tax=Alosa pseudoharengus TaxID=34774 RepID=UPI003F8C7247